MSVRLCVKEDDMIIEKKPFSFLLPAVLTAALIFHALPQTQAVLREIPEKLALAAEAEAKEPVKRKAAGGADDGGNGAVPAAEGAFTDGVFTGSSNGYGGEITVQVTVENGQIADISILSAPGETDPYYSLARSLLDTVKQRQTWEVDTVSGATYSSRGILGAIRNALTGETVDNEEPPSVEPVGTTSQDSFKDPAAYKDGTYYGTAGGFGGSIRVEVVIKDGKIADIRVIDASGETGDYLSRAKGVISRILSKGSPNVDSVSGATYSSTGIINAVKRALSQAAADGSGKMVCRADSVSLHGIRIPAYQLILPDGPPEYADGTYYGTADGFGGEIKVEVTVKKGKIAKVSVLSAPDETPEYLNKAKGVIPGIIKAGSPDVDTVSGATYSSTGIINAVRQALVEAAKKTDEGGSEGGEGDPGEGGGDDPGEGGEGGGDDPGESGPEGGESDAPRFEDGTYTGSGWCDDGEEFYYEINVTIRVEEGKISRVSVSKGEDESDSPEDNDFYLGWAVNGRTRSGQFYPGLPAQIVSSQSADVDTITGATYSSGTIRSIAAQIISEIPVIEGEEAGNREEEAQTENNAEGQAAAPAGLPELSALPAPGSDEPADEESADAAGEDSDEPADEESADAVGEDSDEPADEESADAGNEEDADAGNEEDADAADEESVAAAVKEEETRDEEEQMPEAEGIGTGAGNEGGDGA